MAETVLEALVGTLLLVLGVAAVYAIWRKLAGWAKRPMWALRFSVQAWWRNPRQALVDAPLVVQLLALPFLLLFEQAHKRLYPEAARARDRIFRRNQSAAQTLQKQLTHLALYREGQTLTLCRLVSFEVGEHLVRFTVEPVRAPGFDAPDQPWSFSINWDYFFHDTQVAVADCQFVRWRLDFDAERIQRLMDYAPTLGADLDSAERYTRLNYFFIHGRDQQAQQAHLQALDAARQALEGAMQLHDLQAIQGLAQALGGEVHILSHHLHPEGHGPQLERTPSGFRLTYAVLPNPWAVDFSEDGLLQWWRAPRPENVPSHGTAELATPAGQG